MRSQEKLVEFEGRARATGQPRVIASGDHSCEIGRLGRSQRDRAETVGRKRVKVVHDILQGMQDPHEDGPQLQTHERSEARRTLSGQRPQGNASGGLASVAYKLKDQERAKAEPALLFDCLLIRSANRRNGTRPEPAVAGGTLQKPERYGGYGT